MPEDLEYDFENIEMIDAPSEQSIEPEQTIEEPTPSNEAEGEESTENEDSLNEVDNEESTETESKENSTEENNSEDDSTDEVSSEEEITITEEDFGELISQEFNGLSVDDIKQLIEQTPNENAPKFDSEEEEKLFNWIKENNPGNFNQSAQEFYRLQSLDVDSMTENGQFKDLLFEKYKMENQDLTSDKAKRLFDSEFKSKYPSLDKDDDEYDEELAESKELDKIRLERDGAKAGSFITEERKATISTEKDTADLQSSQEQEKALQEWHSDVDEAMKDFQGLELSNGETTFNFEVENQSEISEMMKDTNKFFQMFANEKNEFQHSKFQEIVAFASNKERFIESLIEHGIGLGREALTDEVNNSSRTTKQGQGSQNRPGAATLDDAIAEAIMGNRQM